MTLSRIETLPTEMMLQVLRHLPPQDVLNARRVCSRFKGLIESHLGFILLNLNNEVLFTRPLTSLKISNLPSLYYRDYYKSRYVEPPNFLNEYAAVERVSNIYYAIRGKALRVGTCQPFRILTIIRSKVNLVWVKANQFFITTLNEHNQIDVYLKGYQKSVKSFILPSFKYLHLFGNYLFLIDQHGLLRKWDLAGHERNLRSRISFDHTVHTFAAKDGLVAQSH